MKKTHRIYNELGLQLRNKTPKRRVKAKLRDDRRAASTSNEVWAMDFVHDQLATGQKIRVLTVVDTFSRFSPAIDPRFSYRAEDVVATLERVCDAMGYPKTIRVDQGSEFVSRDLDLWAYTRGVTLDFSRPGKPTDNAFIEAFNGRLRAECLNAHWFLTLADAREKLEDWRKDYNRASEHPSVYAIELNKLCWFWSGPAGRLAFRWARSVIDLAASVMSSARAKIPRLRLGSRRCERRLTSVRRSRSRGSAAWGDRQQAPGFPHDSRRRIQPADVTKPGKLYLPAVQQWGADQSQHRLLLQMDERQGSQQLALTSPSARRPH